MVILPFFGVSCFHGGKGFSVHIAKEAKNEAVQIVPHIVDIDYDLFLGK